MSQNFLPTLPPPHPTPRPLTNPPSGISFTVCFLQRFCRLALLMGYKSMISIFQVIKIIIRINAWRGIYGSRGSGVQLSKRVFLTVSVEEKGPKCRMKIVQQRREWRHQNRVTDSGEKFWTHLRFGTGSDGDLCGHWIQKLLIPNP